MRNIIAAIVVGLVAVIGSVAILGLVIAATLPLAYLDAVVISSMWKWFAVPFVHVQPISVAVAFGLNLLVHSFVGQRRTQSTSDTSVKEAGIVFVKNYATMTSGLLISWGIAYIVAAYWTHTV